MAKSDGFCNRAEAYEAHDDRPLSPDGGETIGDVIVRRYSRRDNEEVMFPGISRQDLVCFPDMTAELVEIEMAAHGVSIVEIAQESDDWRPTLDGKYNRRTARSPRR